MLAGLPLACGDPSLSGRDGGVSGYDAGQLGPPPPAPAVSPAPTRVPYPVATLRGSAAAKRVIVEGAGNPIATTVLPDGSFCVDVPLLATGPYSFTLFAQGLDGQLSEPAGPIPVTFDVNAPGIPDAETCTGADPAGCPASTEDCDNGRDDNCNNLVDDRDPACATCTDDLLEPNDQPGAPRIEARRYDELRTCPADQDYYGVYLKAQESLSARLFFVHASGNLDLHLLARDQVTVLARSTSLDDDELITHTATATGEYTLRVFSDDGASTTYSLDLRID